MRKSYHALCVPDRDVVPADSHACMLTHVGAEKKNLTFSRFVRKGPDQAIYVRKQKEGIKMV